MEKKAHGNDYPLIKGSRELRANDFTLEAEAGDWNDIPAGWSYYLTAAGNMDEIFGTNVETCENDDYINVYAYTDFIPASIQDFLEVSLWKGDGNVEYYNYLLSDREKKILCMLILEYEIALMTKQLQETRAACENYRRISVMNKQNTCPDCGVSEGQLHHPGCDVERCPICGGQALSCDCKGKYGTCWTGEWPGVAECREFGWYAKFIEGQGWVSCDKDDTGATADLNRLYTDAKWDKDSQRFKMRDA